MSRCQSHLTSTELQRSQTLTARRPREIEKREREKKEMEDPKQLF